MKTSFLVFWYQCYIFLFSIVSQLTLTPDRILAIIQVALFDGDCPHDWLFPRAGAVVCHGGCGTVHAALTAGCPVVVTPAKPDDSDQVDVNCCCLVLVLVLFVAVVGVVELVLLQY